VEIFAPKAVLAPPAKNLRSTFKKSWHPKANTLLIANTPRQGQAAFPEIGDARCKRPTAPPQQQQDLR